MNDQDDIVSGLLYDIEELERDNMCLVRQLRHALQHEVDGDRMKYAQCYQREVAPAAEQRRSEGLDGGGKRRRVAARVAVHRAVKNGKLTKRDRCTKCGATTPLVAYHSDYSKPLDVVWLCRSCLALLQASNRRQNDGERQTDEG